MLHECTLFCNAQSHVTCPCNSSCCLFSAHSAAFTAIVCSFFTHLQQPCTNVQVTSLRELHQQAQKYNSQLQEYNTKLQQDVALSNDSLQKLQVYLMLPQAACFQGHSRKPSELLGSRLNLNGICSTWLASLQGCVSNSNVLAELVLLRQASCCSCLHLSDTAFQ